MNHEHFLASFAIPKQYADWSRELDDLRIRADIVVISRPDLTRDQVVNQVWALSSNPEGRNYWMRVCIDRAAGASPMQWEAGFIYIDGLVGLPGQKLTCDEINRLL